MRDGDEEEDQSSHPEVEEGDQIYAVSLDALPEEIHATSTPSQRLAENAKRDADPAPADLASDTQPLPTHLQDFASVFLKGSFDMLPEPKVWDHAIELIPDAKPTGCKVYPLSPLSDLEL